MRNPALQCGGTDQGGEAKPRRDLRLLAALVGCLSILFTAPITAAPTPAGDGLERLPATTKPLRYSISVTPDLARDSFTARGTLDFEVLAPTRQVIVNADGLDIRSALLDGHLPARISYDRARQRVLFAFATHLKPGPHRIEVAWSGSITRNVEGLFKVDYPTPSGATKQMLFTHLCCIATARKFAPLWDQPDLKAVFDIELIVPDGLQAVSNMPVARRDILTDGRARFRFAPTPKMSSYLLFFAAGEFDRVTREVGSTELGVVLQRGNGNKGSFALDATARLLSYYNDYFATPYPLPKLDSIGMPGAGNFGAMENWGAIFYFEPYIAVDPARSNEQDRQRVFEIVAHEVSHQWFGNLVTMKWWDDLWLNEGFASWMATKAGDHFHPEWKPWLHAADSRERAFRLDALHTTHPIIREVHNLEEAELAFDEITYEKGSQVIRMIESWVGEEAFRTAIRAHIRDHAYENAVTADFLHALDAASDLPVDEIIRDYTEQDGVPLIEILSTRCETGEDTTLLRLRQGRFGLDTPSKASRTWSVPVTAAVIGSGNHPVRRIVRGPLPIELRVPGCGPVKVNIGETGYHRTLYDRASFAALGQHFAELPAADQLGLLNDSYGLAEGGYISFADYLDLASHVGAASDPLLLLDNVRNALELDGLYAGLPGQARFRAFIHGEFGPLLGTIGWTSRPDERPNSSVLRNALIDLLSRTGNREVIAEAARRFEGAPGDPALLPGDVRNAILMATGAGADFATFAKLADRATQATDSAEQRIHLLALANANDPAIADRALEFALTDVVPAQMFTTLLDAIAERHPALVFDFVTSRADAIAPKMNSFERASFVSTVAAKGVDAALADRLSAIVSAQSGAAGKESAERADATIRYRERVRREGLPQVDSWLAEARAR